jgi:o-succinylbenzoate---CoA ligase
MATDAQGGTGGSPEEAAPYATPTMRTPLGPCRRDEPRTPRLVRLADEPASLPAALARTWEAGDAAVVAPPDAALPTPVGRALDGELALPYGTALVVPTSGSTGAPRAVVLSHAALEASTAASIAALGCAAGERWALALPLRHVAGLQVLARARGLGTDAHVVPDAGDPRAIASAAAHAEHIALVPTQLVRCLDAGVDLAAFRSVLVGGGPLAPERAAEARAQGVRLVQSYGMTETCGGCVYDGRPLDGVEADVDAAGRVRLRGPMRATGYLGAGPDDDGRFTPDGWFVTDDLGRIAADGTLEVLGRSDAMINTGGVKVDPVAVETLLRADVTLADVVVLGVPDAEWGERVRAVVVPVDPAVPPRLDALRARVGAALPTAHAPRELVVVDRIERDGLGKLSAMERARLRGLPATELPAD